MSLQDWLPIYQYQVNQSLSNFFEARYPESDEDIEKTFEAALRYSVEGGGKRLRPILAMLAFEHTA